MTSGSEEIQGACNLKYDEHNISDINIYDIVPDGMRVMIIHKIYFIIGGNQKNNKFAVISGKT